MAKPKHIPIRTCVACRETDEKRDLLRVVRQPDGSVAYDPKGKLSGRGAYVCARAECINLARKQKKLERSLKVSGIAEGLFSELGDRAAAAKEVEHSGVKTAAQIDTRMSSKSEEDPRDVLTQESEGEEV